MLYYLGNKTLNKDRKRVLLAHKYLKINAKLLQIFKIPI